MYSNQHTCASHTFVHLSHLFSISQYHNVVLNLESDCDAPFTLTSVGGCCSQDGKNLFAVFTTRRLLEVGSILCDNAIADGTYKVCNKFYRACVRACMLSKIFYYRIHTYHRTPC